MTELLRTTKLLAPTRDTHNNWNKNDPIIPEGILCVTEGRINSTSVEYFIGDGSSKYSELKKHGYSLADIIETGTGNAVTKITFDNGYLTIAKEKTFLTSSEGSEKQDKDTAVTHDKETPVGTTTLPVYVASDGKATAISLTATASALCNSLSVANDIPVDNDYYISQYVNGGTTTTTYHRRSMSLLASYMKTKISLTTTGIGNAITSISYDNSEGVISAVKGLTFLTSHQDISGKQDKSTAVIHGELTQVGSAYLPVYVSSDGTTYPTTYSIYKEVPSDAVFTDTTYTLTQDSEDGHKLTFTPSDGEAKTFTIPDNNTTYTAGTGLYLNGTQFNHTNSITAGTAGTKESTSGTEVDVPYLDYDSEGHIKDSGIHTHSITGFLYSSVDETGEGNVVTDVVATNSKLTVTKGTVPIKDEAVKQSETTSEKYKPIMIGYNESETAGSGMTTEIVDQVYMTNSIYCQPSTGKLYASRVYNAAFADYAECFENENRLDYNLIKHRIVEINELTEKLELAKENSLTTIGIVSDTYGHLLNGTDEEINSNIKIPIGLAGTLWVDAENVNEGRIGNLICSGKDGKARIINDENNKGCIVGKIIKIDKDKKQYKVLLK